MPTCSIKFEHGRSDGAEEKGREMRADKGHHFYLKTVERDKRGCLYRFEGEGVRGKVRSKKYEV